MGMILPISGLVYYLCILLKFTVHERVDARHWGKMICLFFIKKIILIITKYH